MPSPIKPSALRRTDAASFCGISTTQFGRMVKSGHLPSPRNASGAKIWLRYELQDALNSLEIAKDKREDEGCDTVFNTDT